MPDLADPAARYILVVEDDPDLRLVHGEVLEEAGHLVRTAADGLEALELIEREGPPVVIVLDLRMPRMSGWDLVDRLRARAEWRDIALVVVAAHYQIREEAAALRAQAWLHKPVSIDDLARVVGRHVRRAHPNHGLVTGWQPASSPLDAVLLNAADAITVQRPDGSLAYANLAAARTLGYGSPKRCSPRRCATS